MLQNAITWAKERPALAAAGGGALLLAIVLVLIMLAGGATTPSIGTQPGAAVPGNVGTDAGALPDQPGSTVAGDGETRPGATAQGTTPGASAAAPADDVESARATETFLNAGVAPVNPTGGGSVPPANLPASNPVTSSAPVVAAGRTLEAAQRRVQECIEGGQDDVFDCLALVEDAVDVVRIHEDSPQGAVLATKASNKTRVVISFRGDDICRTLGDSGEDCNAWTTAD